MRIKIQKQSAMSNLSLKEHYERKYQEENIVESIPSINEVDIPRDRFEAALKFFPKYFKGEEILELGAGDGRVAKALLLKDQSIKKYTLGDISRPRLNGVRENLNDARIDIVEIDADDVSAIQGSYDAVIMIALIEHLVDPLRAMQRIHTLLKPGGFVYIDTPNIAKYDSRFKLLTGRFPSTASRNEGLTTYYNQPVDLYDEGHLHYFTFRSLSLLLTERCGFSKVEKLGYDCGGRIPLGKSIHNQLALWKPELFSELAIIAYA